MRPLLEYWPRGSAPANILLQQHRAQGRHSPDVNLSAGPDDQHGMWSVLWFLIVCLCAYGAYRSIRGGFSHSQSEKLSGYGIVGCIVLIMLAASLVAHLF